jgi:hypothetical protein
MGTVAFVTVKSFLDMSTRAIPQSAPRCVSKQTSNRCSVACWQWKGAHIPCGTKRWVLLAMLMLSLPHLSKRVAQFCGKDGLLQYAQRRIHHDDSAVREQDGAIVNLASNEHCRTCHNLRLGGFITSALSTLVMHSVG